MHPFSFVNNQRGSVLIVALLMLVVLTLLGISSTTTSTVELQISGNDKLYKRSFFAADGGTAAGSELIEQNIEERDWTNYSTRGNIGIITGDLYLNRDTDAGIDPIPSDTNQDAIIPLSAIVDPTADPFILKTSVPHTNLKIVGNSQLSTGSAVQLAAGYEGKGKGAGGGGAWIIYDVRAQHRDVRDTSVTVLLGWKHVM
jgi:Tfp pilus assembly protein PilX